MFDSMEIRDSDFEEMVLRSDRPVLVHFWASWSQSSRMMQLIVDRLAVTVDNWADVYIVNVDRSPALVKQFEVCDVPTFIVFFGGKTIDRRAGAMTEEQMILLLGAGEFRMPETNFTDSADNEGLAGQAA